MPYTSRITTLVTLQNAVSGPSDGVVLDVRDYQVLVVEISGTFSNLEVNFEVSVDGGVTYWPVGISSLSGEALIAKSSTPGLYRLENTIGATHARARVASTGVPTGAMTVKAVQGL